MANPLYSQLNSGVSNNPMLNRLLEFKKTVNGNPQEIVQNMLNSGKITQAQINQYAQQANQLYNTLGKFIK